MLKYNSYAVYTTIYTLNKPQIHLTLRQIRVTGLKYIYI
jgi:hypothetical protein